MRYPIRDIRMIHRRSHSPCVAFPVRCNAHLSAQTMFVIPRKKTVPSLDESGHIRSAVSFSRRRAGPSLPTTMRVGVATLPTSESGEYFQ